MSDDIVGNNELIIRRGAKAWQRILETDPVQRMQTDRYVAALAKLKVGMHAMLASHLRSEEENDAFYNDETIDEESKKWVREDSRLDAADELLGYIDDMSEALIWTLIEAIGTLFDGDDRAWKEKEKS